MNKLDHNVIEFVIKKQIKESISDSFQTVDKLILSIVFYFFNL